MKIAFVGKGGAGKTTISSLFTSSLIKNNNFKDNFAAIDADINMHLAQNFNTEINYNKLLSNPDNSRKIKEFLIGENDLVNHINEFRKTTPPARKSNLINWKDKNSFIYNFSQSEKMPLFMVGTCMEEEIGTSCYHNNLSILENILSHSIDIDFILSIDMVAGTDAFSNSLFLQTDFIVLVIEPTLKGIAVYDQYKKLSEYSNIFDKVFFVANKIKTQSDKDFVLSKIDNERILGFVSSSNYLDEYNKTGGEINFDKLEEENKLVFDNILKKTEEINIDNNKKLLELYDLHKKYVNQAFIKDRFGNLTNQIDKDFKYE